MSRTHKRPAPVQGEINPERFDPMSWGAEARRPLSALVGIDHVIVPNPEPQKVLVESPKVHAVTATLDADAPAKRRAGLPVPAMEPHVPAGHVDAMADVHSWDR